MQIKHSIVITYKLLSLESALLHLYTEAIHAYTHTQPQLSGMCYAYGHAATHGQVCMYVCPYVY
jgi:hypothetical protein